MAFPLNPTNGQTTVVNGVLYTYSTALGAWVVTSSGGALIVATSISATGNITGNILYGSNASVVGTVNTGTLAATTISIAGSGNVTSNFTAGEITNTRINPRVVYITSAASIQVNGDTTDQCNITALASATTIYAPTGTPVSGQKITYRFLDNGTAHGISGDPMYDAIGVSLPTTTVANKYLYVGCIYNEEETRWDVVSVAQQV